MTRHVLIVIPGLGDEKWINIQLLKWIACYWRRYGFDVHIYPIHWRDRGEHFEEKFQKLLRFIDAQPKDHQLSLIGISAGGSMALNAFIHRREKVHKMVSVCGRLRKGPESGLRSFSAKTKTSHAFADSVIQAEKNEKLLIDNDRKRILTFHARWGDELVPPATTTIPGAMDESVPMAEHMLSIGSALTLFSRRIRDFLTETL